MSVGDILISSLSLSHNSRGEIVESVQVNVFGSQTSHVYDNAGGLSSVVSMNASSLLLIKELDGANSKSVLK